MANISKEEQLLKLAKRRQSDVYDGYKNISCFANGAYECDFVSPYSKSAHNVDAEIFVVLQDWSSEENLSGVVCEETNRLGYTPSVGTNKNLIRLIIEHLGLELKDTYATNLFPFIKPGEMSANIEVRDLRRAASEYTIPMIGIINPRIVVALGMKTFNAIRCSSGLEEVCNMDEAASQPFDINGSKVFFQAHPSQQSQNKRGARQVANDWGKMTYFSKKGKNA